jgi:hypothetical protein
VRRAVAREHLHGVQQVVDTPADVTVGPAPHRTVEEEQQRVRREPAARIAAHVDQRDGRHGHERVVLFAHGRVASLALENLGQRGGHLGPLRHELGRLGRPGCVIEHADGPTALLHGPCAHAGQRPYEETQTGNISVSSGEHACLL